MNEKKRKVILEKKINEKKSEKKRGMHCGLLL